MTNEEYANLEDDVKPEDDINLEDVARLDLDKALYFKSGNNEILVQVNINGHKEIKSVSNGGTISEEFKRLYLLYQRLANNMKAKKAREKLDMLIGAYGIKCKKYTLNSRIAPGEGMYLPGDNEEVIWYDLTNDCWEYIKILPSIDGTGWSIETETPLPMFYRWDHQTPQATPKKVSLGESISIINKFFDCNTGIIKMATESDKLLYTISLITKFVPAIQHTIDLVIAPAGSSKSYQDKIKKLIVDPSKILMFGRPERMDKEVTQNVFHHWLYCVDNCNELLSHPVSDFYSRVVTGGYESLRQLYSNDSDFVRNLSYHCISINGIINPITKSDLLSRSIKFELAEIDKYIGPDKLDALFNDIRPKLLGAIFTVLSRAMYIKKTTVLNLEINRRMTEFIEWGYCIAEVLCVGNGKIFIDEYEQKIKDLSAEVIEDNSVAKVLRFMILEMKKGFEGNMKDLLIYLTFGGEEIIAGGPVSIPSILDKYIETTHDGSVMVDFPDTPIKLAMRITSIENDLKEQGICITKHRSNGIRIIRIKTCAPGK